MPKLPLSCSLMALAGVLIAKLLMAQTVQLLPQIDNQSFLTFSDRAIIIKGRTAGSIDCWLWVEAHNGYQWQEEGFNPSYTRIVTQYKPLIRKLPTGQFEICFTSEIALGIP